VLRQQLARAGDALFALGGGDGHGLMRAVLQGLNRRGQGDRGPIVRRGTLSGYRAVKRQGRRTGGGGKQEASARRHAGIVGYVGTQVSALKGRDFSPAVAQRLQRGFSR
jgi:hypothetical protein